MCDMTTIDVSELENALPNPVDPPPVMRQVRNMGVCPDLFEAPFTPPRALRPRPVPDAPAKKRPRARFPGGEHAAAVWASFLDEE